MRTRIVVLTAALTLAASLLAAHELFLKLERYFVEPHTPVRIAVLNGTFAESESPVARDRLADLSVVSPAGRLHLDTLAWVPESTATTLTVQAGDAGTYVVGASLKPRMIELSAQDFNAYLEHDGIPDILALRRERGELDRPATERYHKHVKAVFQAGERRSGNFDRVLGYPAEIVPLNNPYALSAGGTLRVRALVDGQPVKNQLVFAGGENAEGAFEEQSARTRHDGTVEFTLDTPGRWYIRFIHMAPVSAPDMDYESKWATLTFAVR